MKPYMQIVSHYESCLERHGDTHLGVDWPKREDVDKRYRVMLSLIDCGRFTSVNRATVLDFGCGASHLYEYILRNRIDAVRYSGLDLSPKFVALSREKYPANDYYCLDVLEVGADLPSFDYVVMNGVFTEKRSLSFDEMFAYFRDLLRKVFPKARIGLAFNVMSKHVDWERDDLFHLPFDTLAGFLKSELTRNFVIRNDYGLYEYTTYLYK